MRLSTDQLKRHMIKLDFFILLSLNIKHFKLMVYINPKINGQKSDYDDDMRALGGERFLNILWTI